jgi:hypothetical protein
MSTENRSHSQQSVEKIDFNELLYNSIHHGHQLTDDGVDAARASVAVQAYLLNYFPEDSIIRRNHSPFDVFVLHDELLFSVFLDQDCHQLITAVVEYLAKDDREIT